MKIIKVVVIILVFLFLLLLVGKSQIQAEVNEDVLPVSVYEEDTDLLVLVNTRLSNLFLTPVTNKYTLVEEVVNLIILDSIKENINSEYDPLSDCETTECNYIIYDDNYYISYIWAELNNDNQLIIHVSLGSNVFIGVNTVFYFYFDIDIDYTGLGIELTLNSYDINDINLSIDILDKIFSRLDIDEIESQVTKGELNLTDYSYSISFSLLP